jgi:hypothetical protein
MIISNNSFPQKQDITRGKEIKRIKENRLILNGMASKVHNLRTKS